MLFIFRKKFLVNNIFLEKTFYFSKRKNFAKEIFLFFLKYLFSSVTEISKKYFQNEM